MRLFVAVVPPDAVLDEIAAVIARVRPTAPELSWARRDQWHLTLAFLGAVDERRLPDLTTRLERAANRHDAFELSFGGAGRFDRRVLWAGVRGDSDRLVGLASAVAAAGRRAGIELPDRPYRPHLTLARSRGRNGRDLRPLVAAVSDFGGTAWPVNAVHLIESRLGPKPAYTTLATWALRRRQGETHED